MMIIKLIEFINQESITYMKDKSDNDILIHIDRMDDSKLKIQNLMIVVMQLEYGFQYWLNQKVYNQATMHNN